MGTGTLSQNLNRGKLVLLSKILVGIVPYFEISQRNPDKLCSMVCCLFSPYLLSQVASFVLTSPLKLLVNLSSECILIIFFVFVCLQRCFVKPKR